jgi:RHS repeat-associated protein
VLAEVRYKAWGEERYNSGAPPTSLRFTGQRAEAGLGLYDYGARLYDPALGRWVQPDSIVPGVGEGGNPSAVGYVEKNTYSALTVDYHEDQLLNEFNLENNNKLTDSDFRLPSAPVNSMSFDRYAYCLNNSLRYIDPSGHDPVPPENEELLQTLRETVKIIWRNPPNWAKDSFIEGGRRIIMVDKPHGNTNYWHINTDLKALQNINHKNIEGVVNTYIAVRSALSTGASSALQAVSRSPIPLFFWIEPSSIIHPQSKG